MLVSAPTVRRPIDPNAIDVWVFDLDNTLYPASTNLFDQIDRRIGSYIASLLEVTHDEARRRQKHWFRQYGTSLKGLMVEHAIDPDDYLSYVHDIDLTPVPPSPMLEQALARLPGRKLVYTNASAPYAHRVLNRIGIADHFETVYDIVAAAYVPKPVPAPYRALVARHDIDPRRACMVEDIAHNLEPAAALGMRTVWVRGKAAWRQPRREAEAHVDVEIDTVAEWLAVLTGARHGRPVPHMAPD